MADFVRIVPVVQVKMMLWMRRAALILYYTGAALLTLVLLLVNLRLYYPRGADYGPDRDGADVRPQLRFIGDALRHGAGERMQELFPEGYFFTHALYGLAWVEVGMRRPFGDPLREAALNEAHWALRQIDTPAGRAPFAATLDPPHGVFYVGWSSWLRGGTLILQDAGVRDEGEVNRFAADCAALAAAFDRSPTPFLPAYLASAWPVDSVVAVAALRLHDKLLQPRFAMTIARWLALARTMLDPNTSLLPHRVDWQTGKMLEGARGSSQSIMARFLFEIDPGWGRQQYEQFRRNFVPTPLGVLGVREYPHCIDGERDVDTGPLVLGLSASASVVTLGAALVHGDCALAVPLVNTIETVGLPLGWSGTKRYAFGTLPVGDAFLVWSKTARPWVAQQTPAQLPPVVRWWWRWSPHALTLAFITLLWLPLWVRRRKRVKKYCVVSAKRREKEKMWPGLGDRS